MIYPKYKYKEADKYYESLKSKGARIEIKNKNRRTYSQNRYLHLILAYFGMETGYVMETVKQKFFKLEVNRDIFLVVEQGNLGDIETVRSSAKLSTKEMGKCIDKFHLWSSQEVGVNLPTVEDKEWLSLIESEATNNIYLWNKFKYQNTTLKGIF